MGLKRAAAAVVLFTLFAGLQPAAQQPAFNRYEVLSVFEGYLEAHGMTPGTVEALREKLIAPR